MGNGICTVQSAFSWHISNNGWLAPYGCLEKYKCFFFKICLHICQKIEGIIKITPYMRQLNSKFLTWKWFPLREVNINAGLQIRPVFDNLGFLDFPLSFFLVFCHKTGFSLKEFIEILAKNESIYDSSFLYENATEPSYRNERYRTSAILGHRRKLF